MEDVVDDVRQQVHRSAEIVSVAVAERCRTDEVSALSSVSFRRSCCTGTTRVPSAFRTMSMGRFSLGRRRLHDAEGVSNHCRTAVATMRAFAAASATSRSYILTKVPRTAASSTSGKTWSMGRCVLKHKDSHPVVRRRHP